MRSPVRHSCIWARTHSQPVQCGLLSFGQRVVARIVAQELEYSEKTLAHLSAR